MIRTSEYELLPENVVSYESLEAKRICCKSACMNCPYNFTVKKHGLLFKKIDYDEIRKINKYFDIDIRLNYKAYDLVILKGFLVAIILTDEMFVQKLQVHPFLSKKVLSKELIESYYFY